ncbi:hypothetical protein E2C01_083632 [Portunus trituberculatus]|uniref:Uncharacterized protein n=1 Tax=Portunus trituberculatus TaxID=210409 RepID=A0A5B7J2N5_PORTR|nr:hypothetical protein [Portunus trituberculatus]
MASHGVAVLAPWSLSLPVNPVDKVPYLESVMEWVGQNLQEQLQLNGLMMGVVLNLDNYVCELPCYCLVHNPSDGLGQPRHRKT